MSDYPLNFYKLYNIGNNTLQPLMTFIETKKDPW